MIKMITSVSFFLSLITAALVSFVPAVDSKCIRSQQLSLINFKKSLVFDASLSSKLISWNSSTDCCSWDGITCSGNGSVVSLDISNEYISSTIHSSSSLFHLHHLQSLNLARNEFKGSHIPAAIGNLTSLRHLNLSYAGLSGKVPNVISQLENLDVLDISTDMESGYDPPSIQNISMLIQNLTKLTELLLDGVVISAPFPGFVANFSNLTVLSLSLCGLQGTFPKEIFQVPSLKAIDLSWNSELSGSLPEFSKNGSLGSLVLFSTNFSGIIPNSIGDLDMLSIINLSDANFSGSIPRSVGNLTNLVRLDLSMNSFTGSVPSFNRAKNLANIVLSYNNLTGDISSTHWKNFTNLINLELGDNRLQGNLPAPLFCLPRLQTLVLFSNKFSGQIPEFCNVSSHFQLQTLMLDDNKLEGLIPMSIFNLRGLQELFLTSNNLNGSFPLDRLSQLKNLTLLHLSYNKLHLSYDHTNFSYSSFPQFEQLRLASGNLRKIPDFLRNQSSLIILDLSDNHLHGMIPNWIWRFGGLYRLNLSCNSLETLEGPLTNLTSVWLIDLHSNMLQGQIPMFESPFIYYVDYSNNSFSSSMLTDITAYFSTAMSFFSISSNNLSGIIPESICNSPYLALLDLSNNSFTGSIPHCVTTFGRLRVLNLRRNKFSNVKTLPENCTLRSVDVSENQLQGQLPRSLVNCTELEILNLGRNQITDTFPCFLKNISTLRILVLGSNNFHGPIGCPEINGTWPMLQIIDLADNSFDGEIPGISLSTWKAMMEDDDGAASKYLQMQEGTNGYISFQDAVVVSSKGSQIDLVKILIAFTVIDFSCNKFNGSIPKEIGGLKSLRVLNLSSNAFTGAIPSSLSSLQVVESLDLSQNNLSGEIPPQFAKLNFLSFLNLSYNQLVGRIPTSTQFSTFPKSSFQGNKDLWGPPLTADNTAGTSPPTIEESHQDSGDDELDWDVISVAFGFTFGLGISIGSLFFCKRWRNWYYLTMYNILLKIFPQLEQRFGSHRRHVSIHQRYGRR